MRLRLTRSAKAAIRAAETATPRVEALTVKLTRTPMRGKPRSMGSSGCVQ